MRLPLITTGLLALALAMGVLPAALAPAGAQATSAVAPAVEPAARRAAVPSDGAAGGWVPGELDVDWSAFLAEHRDEYERSSFATAAAQHDAESREAVRDDMRARYLAESGEAPAGGEQGYADLGTARQGALASQYYDECDDGSNLPEDGAQVSRGLLFSGGEDGDRRPYNPPPEGPPPAIDLRSMFMVQSTDEAGRFDQTGFLVYACQPWAFNNLAAGGITFGLYTNFETSEAEYPTILGDEESGPDFVVSIFPEHNVPERPYQIMAIRTPSRDTSTWSITYLDVAKRLDAYEIDGVVPTSALGDFTADSGFAWTVEVADTQQPAAGRDWFPEHNYLLQVGEGDALVQGTHVPQFPVPEGCGTQEESGNYALTPQAVPNDDGYPVQWYHPVIRTPAAWDTIRDSSLAGRTRPVTVAVVDTGIDATRIDFLDGAPRVTAGLDAVYGLELEGPDNDGAIGPILGPLGVPYESIGVHPRNSDRDPHGTAVASLMGARGNNLFGIAGVDWGVRLMPIRVVDVNGCISADDVADGIKWAVDHGADVINISLASPDITSFGGADEPPECGDGIDNDTDGVADSEDPGCVNDADGSEGFFGGGGNTVAACADGRDNNDPDQLIDAEDPECEGADDDSEAATTSIIRPPETPECTDGIDNDGDGFVDAEEPAADPGCDGSDDASEGPFPGQPIEEDAPACADGRDNSDADAAADMDDVHCDSPLDEDEGDPGSTRSVDPLREVIDYALEQGVPVVAAAGNFGADDDPTTYPAAYPGVISVGAADRAGTRAFYSSTGRWLDIVAPGGTNAGTLRQDLAVLWELDTIRSVAGTSYATPLVTGAISLYLGLNPHIARGFEPAEQPPDPAANFPDLGYQRTVDDVHVAVQNAGRDIAPRGHDLLTGWGLLDVDRMLDVEATGGPLIDPARVQLPRTNADRVVEAAEGIALSRPLQFPPFVTFTRSDVPVDALAGAPLLAEAPLLVSPPDGLAPSTPDVLRQLLPDGGRVYLLGGEAALSPAVEAQIRDLGYETVRLAGASRVETALAIAEEVRRLHPGSSTVGVIRADGGNNPTAQWADALTGGAWAAETRTPMVVTSTSSLSPLVADALQRWGTTDTVVFGGTAAVSDAVLAALPAPRRVAGASRAETAVEIARTMWEDPDGYLLANGFFARGWVPALAAAGWAADLDRPLLYTGATDVPPATEALLSETCPGPDGVRIIGGASLVTGTAESTLLEAVTC